MPPPQASAPLSLFFLHDAAQKVDVGLLFARRSLAQLAAIF
jgi:hypothetical protein